MENNYYENAYNSMGKEANRLRAVARLYNFFYNQIEEAFKDKNWDKVEQALKECE